ncbi:MAG: redoxin domain-containing protein, partial [Actinocrinis sp.]
MTETARLEPGEQAPQFTLPDADGKTVSLSDYAGRKVIVYVYPNAMTPG